MNKSYQSYRAKTLNVDGRTDMLKTVTPAKTTFSGGVGVCTKYVSQDIKLTALGLLRGDFCGILSPSLISPGSSCVSAMMILPTVIINLMDNRALG